MPPYMLYDRSMDWAQYLLQQQLISTTAAALDSPPATLTHDQRAALQRLERGFGRLLAGQTIQNLVLTSGLNAMVRGVEDVRQATTAVCHSLEQLRADFNWGMSDLAWKLEVQSQQLQALLEILQSPLDTQARELRRRAEEAYGHGWYDEALRDFLAAEQKNYQDFTVHQAIGNIYLHHAQPGNLDQALAYYLKAGKYAAPKAHRFAAFSYMHAGFVHYLQRQDAPAIAMLTTATQLAPDLSDVWFNLAKFAAAGRQTSTAVQALERAIRLDSGAAVKASLDADFNDLGNEITQIIDRLRAEAKAAADQAFAALQKTISGADIRWGARTFEANVAAIRAFLDQDTYLGYLDAKSAIEALSELFRYKDGLSDLQETGTIRRMVFVDGGHLVCCGTREHATWYTHAGRSQNEKLYQGKGYVSSAITISPDGRYLSYTNLSLKGAELWDMQNPTQTPAFVLGDQKGVSTVVAFTSDSRLVATGTNTSDRLVRVWDLSNGKLLATFRGHTNGITALAFHPDNTHLVSGSTDKTARVWDLSTGQLVATLTGHTNSRRMFLVLQIGGVISVAFSPDGQLLATGGMDGVISLWETQSWQLKTVLSGHTDFISALAFSPDGQVLASGSRDKTIRLWDTVTGKPEGVLQGHTNVVTTFLFYSHGRVLLSAAEDNTLRTWAIAGQR